MKLHCKYSELIPKYDEDVYGNEFISNPFWHYEKMRQLGPVVWLPKHKNFAVTQYAQAKEVLYNHRVFSSASGVAADDTGCSFLKGNTLASDPPVHDQMRRAMGAPMLPGALKSESIRIQHSADKLIDNLVARGSFEGMADLARYLPETIVTELIGLPEDGRENMLDWASASFNIIGIQNERGRQGVKTIAEMRNWIETQATPDRLKPGSWTSRIHHLADTGAIESRMTPLLIRDYINPSLDTTISATGQLIWQLGSNPDQWELLRKNQDYIDNAVNEAVRLASPIRIFSRTLTENYELAGLMLPKGARIMVLFASTNRDERQFSDPNKFDITRDGSEHLGFGHGIHMCVGMHLARMEMSCLLRAMIERVESISVGQPRLAVNNTIYNFESLPVIFTGLANRASSKTVSNCSSLYDQAEKTDHWLNVTITKRIDIADDIVALLLKPQEGAVLPEFSAGAHIDIEVKPDLIRQYSLSNDPQENNSYRIAVLRDENGRGGSVALHETLHQGDKVRIGRPRNNFPLSQQFPENKTILFAGGIGITPILAMSYALQLVGSVFEAHYCLKTITKAAFKQEIESGLFAESYKLYFDDDERTHFDAKAILSEANKNADVYVCGPSGYMEYILASARAAGFSEQQLHYEYFGAEIDTDGDPFTVQTTKSGKVFVVLPEQTILGCLEERGIKVHKSCESGVCGTCVVGVVEGTPDHRDLVLTEEEKAENRMITVCCSRSKSRKLILEI